MLLFLLSYLGGALTIFAPCILPVIPFVFAKVDQPFRRSGLPLLVGMALTFAAVASLGALGGAWVVQLNEAGRWAALAFLALMGIALLSPRLAERSTRGIVALGSRLSQVADHRGGAAQGAPRPVASSVLLGVATGLLWVPCAGPVLGAVLTAAALNGASVHTSLLLLAYAAGAASSLAVVLLAGGRVFAALKRSLGAGEWMRRALGVAVLASVALVALGLDTRFFASWSSESSARVEQRLLDRWHARPVMPVAAPATAPVSAGRDPAMLRVADIVQPAAPLLSLPVEGNMPALDAGGPWLNSPPLDAAALRGKVVLVDFWTFGCINCRNVLPHVRQWAAKYKDQGLVVIGVHSPEFAFEKNIGNVKKALVDLDVTYPVVVDNDFKIWRAYSNNYWPAAYFVDARGRIRFHHFGEGEYEKSEQVIRQLLHEAKNDAAAPGRV